VGRPNLGNAIQESRDGNFGINTWFNE